MRPPAVVLAVLVVLAVAAGATAQQPPILLAPDGATVLVDGEGSLAEDARLANFELHAAFALPPHADGAIAIGDICEVVLSDGGCGGLRGIAEPLADAALPGAAWQELELRCRQDPGRPAVVSAWLNGTQVLENVVVPASAREPELAGQRHEWRPQDTPDFADGEFAIVARFRSRGDGTLAGRAPAGATRWAANGKTLFLRGGHLVYDIGWVGSLTSRSRFDDGEEHCVVLTHDGATAQLYVDGALEGERADFTSDDDEGHVLKVGATSTNFGGGLVDGTVDSLMIFDAPLGRNDALAASRARGTRLPREPVVTWRPDATETNGDSGGVRQRVRLRAGTPPVRFANVWTRPLVEVDHAALIAGWDDAALARGRATYRSVCAACHGIDGETVTLPTARPFSLARLENGAAPDRLFETLTRGFRTMPPQTWMTPAQRYDVIHFLREEFLRAKNPSQYVRIDDAYLAALPRPLPVDPGSDGAGQPTFRDFGPGLVAQIGSRVPVGLAVQLPHDVTIGYDLHRMSSVGAWRGGFLDLSDTQHHLQRGEGIARPGSTPWSWSTHWGPIVDDADKPPRGPIPAIRRRGHFVHGRELVLDYEVRGRAVLESPTAVAVGGQIALVHRIRVAAGDQPIAWRWSTPTVVQDEDGHEIELGDFLGGDRVAQNRQADGALLAAAIRGDLGPVVHPARRSSETVHWWSSRLRVPACDRDLVFTVIRTAVESDAELDAFRAWVEVHGDDLVVDPATWTMGGADLWPEPLTTSGKTGEDRGGYAVDTLTLPDGAPLGAWLRTSALDFFSDGRAAVCTLGGDVWIVDGIGADLSTLRWKRFASGLFEPLGLLVVDDTVHVTCRDGLIRVRDLDGDAAADVHQCVYADVDVSPSFHAFNFDLQPLADGRLCYVKSGRYTEFTLPGAVVAIDAASGAAEYVATGFRTPNGMGTLADGSLTVSDNQGNWVPASKISRIRPGGFYGVFRTDRRERDDFDRPFLWLPQDVDSSSGGQLWLDDERIGPLAGRLLHTSFGKGQAYVVSPQRVGGVEALQASCVALPFQFDAGVQRARTNPLDGQVYLVGLSGWQGPADGRDGCLQRIRFTGGRPTFLIGAAVRDGGIALEFTGPLDASAADPSLFEVDAWNYRWAPSYGSAQWSVREPDRQGRDTLEVARATRSESGTQVQLEVRGLQPCDQLRVVCEVRAADGQTVRGTVHLTVHQVR